MQRNTLNSHFPIATPDRSACSIFCRQLLPASACNVHRWICRLWCRRALVSQLRNSQFPCHNIWLLYAHFCAKNDWHCGGLNVTTQKKKWWIPIRFISRWFTWFCIPFRKCDRDKWGRWKKKQYYRAIVIPPQKPQQLTFSQISHRNHFECTWIVCKRNSAMRFVKLQRKHPFQLN